MTDPARIFDELARSLETDEARGRVRRWTRRVGRGQARAVPGPRARAGRWVGRAAGWVGAAVLASILPFVLLLRGATWLYATGLPTWTALAVAAGAVVVLLTVYAAAVGWRLRRRLVLPKRLVQALALVVVAYVGYGLLFLSGANAKTTQVQAEYRALHPLLRLSVATLVLVDSDLLVTDAGRTLEDYAAMGLPPNEASLHLKQPDGYAHAFDLRTAGRPELLNGATRLYFQALGLRTLRHVGTADHLHVSLPPRR